ncbi:MAG: hypothetical protein HKN47_08790, partial [Pirellulaceae bacterium]|nr:hypothetical protein [Pirellulaceae bacterium]
PELVDRETIAARWVKVKEPNYEIETAKEVALKGTSRPNWQASGEYGYKWGSAVHELLELATKTPDADRTKAAVMLATQFGLGNERVEELSQTVDAVTRSEIWTRARQALRCYSEFPLETVSQSDTGQPIITRAVIDLLFEEQDGWVIVDYKTDDIAISEMESAVGYYRPQLDQYAKNFSDATGARVKEIGLYFTRLDRAVSVG